MIRAYWHHSDNFGDALTPYILGKLTGKKIVAPEPGYTGKVFCLTGSLLDNNLKNYIIAGLGSAYSNFSVSPNNKFISVRGPLSKAVVEKCGAKVELVSDGGLLLPLVHKPGPKKKSFRLGILQSWVDIDTVKSLYANRDDTLIINTMSTIEAVIENILKCEATVSSCLHGLVASVCYGIPSYHVKFSNRMVGDGFKFEDFKQSVNWAHETAAGDIGYDKLVKLPYLPEVDLGVVANRLLTRLQEELK